MMPDLNKIKFILVLIMIASLPFSESIKTIIIYLAFGVMLVAASQEGSKT